jgi:hypothetical protein
MVTLALSLTRKKKKKKPDFQGVEFLSHTSLPCVSYADASSDGGSHSEEAFPCFGQVFPQQHIIYLIYSKGTFFCLHMVSEEVHSNYKIKLCVLVHACNLSTWEVVVKRSKVQGQPGLHKTRLSQ